MTSPAQTPAEILAASVKRARQTREGVVQAAADVAAQRESDQAAKDLRSAQGPDVSAK